MSIVDSIVGKHAVIRSYSSGVFAGTITTAEASGPGRMRVCVDGCRRLWRWKAKKGVALSGVAVHGLHKSDNKVDSEINGHIVDDVIEVIPTTDAAKESINDAGE